MGVDFLLATDPEYQEGKLTGKIAGVPCYQEGKVERLLEWITLHHPSIDPQHCLEQAYFYSDSINDVPLLKRVGNPIVVDPDPKLKDYAENADWPIFSFRQ